MTRKIETLILIVILCSNTFAQESRIGKPAPKIKIDNWIYPKIRVEDWNVKRIPKELNGNIIVLDFWFTNCAPCVASIPELNYLAKQYPEIVFLSISFEKEPVLNEFLSKVVMYYPVGSDTSRNVIKAFGVCAYPQTFLINKKGIIAWHGVPFKLDKEIINNVLGIASSNKIKYYTNDHELRNESSAYTFSIHENKLGMGQSSYSHYNPYDINVFNKGLENILATYYKINKSRIITNDTSLLQTNYDITLKADKDLTTEANCVEMLKYLLPDALDFDLSKVFKDTIIHRMIVVNDSLLQQNRSKSIGFGTTFRYDNWEVKGATLKNISDYLENQYELLVEIEGRNTAKFNLVLPSNDLEKTIETLEIKYGIRLFRTPNRTEFWNIQKKAELR